jgi:hypothetical protein
MSTKQVNDDIKNWIRWSHRGESPLPRIPGCVGLESSYKSPQIWEGEQATRPVDTEAAERVERVYMALPLNIRLLVKANYFDHTDKFDQPRSVGTRAALTIFRNNIEATYASIDENHYATCEQ